MTVLDYLTGNTCEMNLTDPEEQITCVRPSGGRLVAFNKFLSFHCSTNVFVNGNKVQR